MSAAHGPDDRATAALFGDGAGAVVVSAGGAPAAIGPAVLGADGTRARSGHRLARGGDLAWTATTPSARRSTGSARSTLEAVAAAGSDARRHRPLRLPPGQRPHPPRGRRAARPRPRAGRRLHRPLRQHLGGDASRSRSPRRTRDGPAARPARRVLLAAFGAGLTWARDRDRVGGCPRRGRRPPMPLSGCAARHRRRPRDRRRDRDRARRRRLAGGRQLPQRRATAPRRVAAADRATPAAAALAVAADVTDAGARSTRCSSAPRTSSARCWCWSTTPACAPTASRRSSSDEDWDRVIETNLSRRLPHTRRALRPMLRARFGRIVNVASVVGPRANAGPGQLRGVEGGPDRADARPSRSRSRAAGSPSTPSPPGWSRPS